MNGAKSPDEVSSCTPTKSRHKNSTPFLDSHPLRTYKNEGSVKNLTDEEVIQLVRDKHIPSHQLEKVCEDFERGVVIRLA